MVGRGQQLTEGNHWNETILYEFYLTY